MATLPLWQYATVTVTSTLMALLSLVTSTIMVTLVKRDLSKVHHRILLCMSGCNIIFNLLKLGQPFLLPEDRVEGRPLAMGDDTTCSASGFIYTTSATSTIFYTAFISINFFLQLKYQWTEEMIVRRVERFYHALTFTYVVGVSAFAWVSESYNPLALVGVCYIAEYPDGCINKDDVECERGGAVSAAIGRIGSMSALIISIIGFVCTYMLHRTVKETLSRGMRRSMATSAMAKKQQDRIRTVTRQCVLYCLVYANSAFWNILTQVLISVFSIEQYLGHPAVFIYLMLITICLSLNGTLNLIIFISPRYQEWRRALPDESPIYVLRCSLSEQEVPKRESRLHDYSGSTGCKRPPHGITPARNMSSVATNSTKQADSDEQRFSLNENSQRQQRSSVGMMSSDGDRFVVDEGDANILDNTASNQSSQQGSDHNSNDVDV